MSDAGLAVGAALHVFAATTGARPEPLRHAFLGPCFSEDEIAAAFSGFHLTRPASMPGAIARALAMGKVVARFTGRAEYGPRALGHRSLLASPSDPSICDRLNAQLKRSGIMPFAPITRSVDAPAMYDNLSSASWSSEFMTVSFNCSDTMIREAPAAVHRDGTARPQVLRQETDPELYEILTAHRAVTGTSSAINTSLNLHEEPMVLSPRDARHCAASAGIEVAQLGELLCCSSAETLDRLTGADATRR
jgi:carbamoyltransferase